MSGYFDAGRLDRPAKVMEIREVEQGVWAWVPIRDIWISLELRSKMNIFSRLGIGARDAAVVAWQQEISLSNAILQGENHLFLTSVTQRNRNQLDIRAALCDPIIFTAKPQAKTGRDEMNRPVVTAADPFTFPGVLTELYRRGAEDGVAELETIQRALVTPKAIKLRKGDIIQQPEGLSYTVRQVMDLDPWKNEYMIEAQEDT